MHQNKKKKCYWFSFEKSLLLMLCSCELGAWARVPWRKSSRRCWRLKTARCEHRRETPPASLTHAYRGGALTCPSHIPHISPTCPSHVPHMSLTYPSHAHYMSLTYPSHVPHMSLTCPPHVPHMSLACPSHVPHISPTYPPHIPHMPLTCPSHAPHMPTTGPSGRGPHMWVPPATRRRGRCPGHSTSGW